jgi:hypothetical protein
VATARTPPELLAGDGKNGLTGPFAGFNITPVTDSKADVHEGVIGIRIRDDVMLGRVGASADAADGKNAGRQRGAMDGAQEAVEVELPPQLAEYSITMCAIAPSTLAARDT